MSAKKFVLYFLIIVFAYAATNKLFFYGLLNDVDRLVLNNETRVVVSGASHGRFSINPEYFSNLENICVKGEQMIFTHSKLKLLMKRSNAISKVIIAVSPSTFSEARDKNNAEREDFFNNLLRYEYLNDEDIITKLADFKGFNSRRRNKYVLGLLPPSDSELRALVKYFLGTKLKKLHPGWGKYEPVHSINLNKNITLRKIEHHYYYKGEVIGSSQNQVHYIQKIAELCKKEGINLYLIRTPEHRDYRENIPKSYSIYFDKLIAGLTANYPNVSFSDYSSFDIKDEYFYDSDHLNYKGGLIFSEMLNETIGE